MRRSVQIATLAVAIAALSIVGIAAAGDNQPGSGNGDSQSQGEGNGQEEGNGNGHGKKAEGALYAATNALTGNAIRVFHRSSDGTLTLVGDTPTGGTGSGGFESSANAVVLGGARGESSPNNLTDEEKLLFATNTGSNTVSVFRVKGDELDLASVTPTGNHPLSVTVSHKLVYVLNGGTTNGSGMPPSITGYRASAAGELTPIANSTRPVSGGAISGATQVSFNPRGDVLVVTEKQANVISTYTVDHDGLATGPIANPNSPGSVGPFGFTFTRSGNLLTSENFGGAAGQGGAASFDVQSDATLTPITPTTVRNFQSDTCWFVLTDDQRFGFVTNAQSNDISSYRVDSHGNLTLLQGDAAHTDEIFPAVGPTILPGDETLSRDSKYLYERNVMDGDVNAYAVGSDGALTLLQRLQNALPPGAIGVAGS